MLAEMCIIPQPQPKYCVYRGSTLLFFLTYIIALGLDYFSVLISLHFLWWYRVTCSNILIIWNMKYNLKKQTKKNHKIIGLRKKKSKTLWTVLKGGLCCYWRAVFVPLNTSDQTGVMLCRSACQRLIEAEAVKPLICSNNSSRWLTPHTHY